MNLHEKCGVFGIYSPKEEDLAGMCYYGLYALQHRGQESCGIVINHDGLFTSVKEKPFSSATSLPAEPASTANCSSLQASAV